MDQFKRLARKLRSGQTSAEARLWRGLLNRQLEHWKFRRQQPVEGYIVDFVSLDAKLIVEVDGATHSTATEIARDAARTRVLETSGFFVIRVTNREVYDDLDSVLETIRRVLRNV
jgi:very-short-patch-repair endonuclease